MPTGNLSAIPTETLALPEAEVSDLIHSLDAGSKWSLVSMLIRQNRDAGERALHRVRIDEVMRGPELADALLEGLGPFMAPVG